VRRPSRGSWRSWRNGKLPAISPPPAAEVTAFLASTRLFGGLDETALDEVSRHLEWLLVSGGQAVCRQGEEGDCLYLVFSGRLAVVREAETGEDVLLGEVGRGDTVGEIAVLTGKTRTATVRALRDVVVARLARASVDHLVERYPGVSRAAIRALAGLLEASQRPERGRSCLALAVVPVGELPVQDFAARLVESLSACGACLHLSAAGIDERLGAGVSLCPDGSVEHGRMAGWINEQESHHCFLVYEADPTPSAWTRRCLRQADRILVVASAEAEPSLGPLGPELARLEEDQGRQIEELVLLHRDPGRRPRETARWLALRPFLLHHHVRLDAADLDRLARFLDGGAVGVVLGGGGARGFAHLGVLRALAEAGIPIDRIGGTSMGAVIGALYARGYDWQTMVELSRWGWVKLQPHKVYTLPLISLLSPVKAEKMLDRMYGDDQIEDLWTDYFCVSTNLSRTEVVVHRRGSLRKAVSASMTIPGITPPMLGPSGDLLVDGGVLNNLPTDVMQRLGDGPVIAVDVSARTDLRAHPSYTDPPSPWQFLASRFRRSAEPRPFPTILRLIHRSALLASDVYAKHAKAEVELFLDLPMEGFDMFAMEAFDDIVEFGYQFARETLANTAWRPESARRVVAL
jgi:predicted acylesterase/phospholipase RssA/CRP-like cAMP-binding protein